MPKLTSRALECAKPKTKPYKLLVDRGLFLHIPPSGVKKWQVRYVVNGKQLHLTLPRPFGSGQGCMSLAEACAENVLIQSQAREGVDYSEQKKKEQALLQKEFEEEKNRTEEISLQQKSVKELFNVWIENGVARSDDNAELNRVFKKDVLPIIGDKPIKDLTENDLRSVLGKMVKRDVRRLAVRTYGDLVQMLSWAEKRQPWRGLMVDGNPADLLDIQQIVGADYDIHYACDRVLSPQEIRELRDKLAHTRERHENAPAGKKYQFSTPLKNESQLALWICLSTACRIGELLMSEWKHINFEKAEWFIPKSNVKGRVGRKQDQTVFLSPFALEKFRDLYTLTGKTQWCFPSKDGNKHVNVKTVGSQVGDRQMSFKNRNIDKQSSKKCRNDDLVLSNGEWTPHDLRRTAATIMQSLGVSLDVIDRCQNHVIQGPRTRRHYLHYDYAQEKKEAWLKLGSYLENVLA